MTAVTCTPAKPQADGHHPAQASTARKTAGPPPHSLHNPHNRCMEVRMTAVTRTPAKSQTDGHHPAQASTARKTAGPPPHSIHNPHNHPIHLALHHPELHWSDKHQHHHSHDRLKNICRFIKQNQQCRIESRLMSLTIQNFNKTLMQRYFNARPNVQSFKTVEPTKRKYKQMIAEVN